MTDNDKNLIRQLMQAGKYDAIYDFMPQYNLEKSQEIIQGMGAKWCCHPDNAVKRLEVPLPILNEPRIRVLKRK
jgi:hypothetical protein